MQKDKHEEFSHHKTRVAFQSYQWKNWYSSYLGRKSDEYSLKRKYLQQIQDFLEDGYVSVLYILQNNDCAGYFVKDTDEIPHWHVDEDKFSETEEKVYTAISSITKALHSGAKKYSSQLNSKDWFSFIQKVLFKTRLFV